MGCQTWSCIPNTNLTKNILSRIRSESSHFIDTGSGWPVVEEWLKRILNSSKWLWPQKWPYYDNDDIIGDGADHNVDEEEVELWWWWGWWRCWCWSEPTSDDDDYGGGVDQTSDNWREASDNSGKLVRPGTWEKMLIVMMMINYLMFFWMLMLIVDVGVVNLNSSLCQGQCVRWYGQSLPQPLPGGSR